MKAATAQRLGKGCAFALEFAVSKRAALATQTPAVVGGLGAAPPAA